MGTPGLQNDYISESGGLDKENWAGLTPSNQHKSGGLSVYPQNLENENVHS